MNKVISLETYLQFLNEGKLMNWMKDLGLTIKDLYFEDSNCKKLRQIQDTMYLFHGTRPQYVSSIKSDGLLISMANRRSREERVINISGREPVIWLSSTYNKSSPEFGGADKKIIMMIVKLETKFLKNFLGSTYKYYVDIPPKNIIWETNPLFMKIANKSPCLKIK